MISLSTKSLGLVRTAITMAKEGGLEKQERVVVGKRAVGCLGYLCSASLLNFGLVVAWSELVKNEAHPDSVIGQGSSYSLVNTATTFTCARAAFFQRAGLGYGTTIVPWSRWRNVFEKTMKVSRPHPTVHGSCPKYLLTK